jgi:hypothetical protein
MCNRDRMYDGKDTRRGKPLHCIVCFDQNVTVFAGRLSKSTGQLMLMRASGVENAISAILFL